MPDVEHCLLDIKWEHYTFGHLNQRRIKMAHFNSLRSDTSNDLKRAPFKGAVLNLHWYKTPIF